VQISVAIGSGFMAPWVTSDLTGQTKELGVKGSATSFVKLS